MNVLGISAFYHDSAASLVQGGEVVAAAQEERFTRVKNDAGFPAYTRSSTVWPRRASASTRSTTWASTTSRFLTFERLLETYLGLCARRGLRSFVASMPVWVKEKVLRRT